MTEPFEAADAVVVFIDLQTGIINVGVTNDPHRMRTAVAALVDLATIFALPVVISCVPTTSGTVAPVLPEITTRLAGAKPLVRSTANPMDDAAFRSALEGSGRNTLIVAGFATEVAVRLAVLSARRAGFRSIVVVDACSGLDSRTESATFMDLSAAGVHLSSTATIAAQLGGDFGTDQGRAAMRALQSTLSLPTHEHERAHEHERTHEHDGGSP